MTQFALVRRPSPRLADGLVTHIGRTPVDVELAKEQWDGYVAAFENSSYKGKEDYVLHAQRYVGDSALTCNARVYPMKKGENVKDKLLPLVQKMCLSLKAK